MKSADNFKIKMILSLFTVDKGKLKVLLFKKGGEPYKGYWSFPSKTLSYDETFASNTNTLLKEYVGLENIYTESFRTFEDKEKVLEDKVVHVTTMGFIDSAAATYQRKENEERESAWFDIASIPKLAYNYEEILLQMIDYLRRRLRTIDMIEIFYPSDFTLPEMQIFCETLEGKEMDRRNFRKKILSLDILEDTGYKSENGTGRPAKLYKFKENIQDISLL